MKHNLKLIVVLFTLFLSAGSLVGAESMACDICDKNSEDKNHSEDYNKESIKKDSGEMTEEEREVLLNELKTIRERINYLKWKLEGVRLKKELNSNAYIVLDINSKEALIKNNERKQLPIASITKLMSSLVAKKYKDTEEEVTITNEMLSTIYNKTDALWPNLVISIKNLLSASLISSINDAAESLNYIVGKNLILIMNKSAEVLNMTQTSFVDAHGISKDNVSSANDIARLLYYIRLKHPDLLEITINDDFWLPDRNNNLIKFTNRNLFHEIPEFIGGKTGFTNASKQTFAGIFEFKENPYIIVLLYSTNRLNDTKKITEWLKRRPVVID